MDLKTSGSMFYKHMSLKIELSPKIGRVICGSRDVASDVGLGSQSAVTTDPAYLEPGSSPMTLLPRGASDSRLSLKVWTPVTKPESPSLANM